MDGPEAAPGHDGKAHVALPHVEQLLALLKVEIFPLIRPAHKEDFQLVIVHHFVAHRRKEKPFIFFDPFICVEMNRLLIHCWLKFRSQQLVLVKVGQNLIQQVIFNTSLTGFQAQAPDPSFL